MAGQPWTDEEKETLILISERGGTYDDALKILKGRSRSGIDKQVSLFRLSLAGKAPEIDMEALRKFIGES